MSLSASIAEMRDWMREHPVLHFEEAGVETLAALLQAWQVEARNMEERLRQLSRRGHVPVTDTLLDAAIFADGKVVPFPAAERPFGRGS